MAFRDELAAAVAEITAAAHDRLVSDRGGSVPFEVEREFRTDVSALFARWSPYGDGDADLVQGLVDAVAALARDHIETARSDVGRVSAVVEQWHGSAAAAFRRSFIGSYELAVAGQLIALRDLGRILAAYGAVMAAAQRTLLAIGQATVAALGDAVGGFEFTVPGSAADPLSGAALLFDPVSLGGPATPGRVDGDALHDVLASMDGAVTRLDEHVDAEEDLIRAVLDTAQARLDANLPYLLPADSGVGDDLDEFESRPGSHVVVEIAALYHAGNVDLTSAAGHYEQAWRGLDLGAVTEPAAFGPWFARTLFDYRTLRQTFSSQVLLATRDELMRHGDDLCGAALLYAEADGIDARQILQVLDTPGSPW
ncbi:hypothetical protein [Virgisporangium aurantiacum]|uniref:Uncharacterized protein n=1 Tax=Virgisporangium aurantiacum TaxID=175570 RepID=A0A8J3Z450_9ACTN|nr:hypothetical protein [Virgisporangium aurantiacum]GIJ55953.1 hypothetical protein Vau01_034690 [Virgisporangium aurantiacum]